MKKLKQSLRILFWAVKENRQKCRKIFTFNFNYDSSNIAFKSDPRWRGGGLTEALEVRWTKMIVPTSYENYMGFVRDPTGHEREIETSISTIESFLSDMHDGTRPSVTLDALEKAVSILGDYAGRPDDYFKTLNFFGGPDGVSYLDLKIILQNYSKQMKSLIDNRFEQARQKGSINYVISDDDIPFWLSNIVFKSDPAVAGRPNQGVRNYGFSCPDTARL